MGRTDLGLRRLDRRTVRGRALPDRFTRRQRRAADRGGARALRLHQGAKIRRGLRGRMGEESSGDDRRGAFSARPDLSHVREETLSLRRRTHPRAPSSRASRSECSTRA